MGTPSLLERPRLSIPAVSDEILSPLRLGGELEQSFAQDHVTVHRGQRLVWLEDSRTERIQQGKGLAAARV